MRAVSVAAVAALVALTAGGCGGGPASRGSVCGTMPAVAEGYAAVAAEAAPGPVDLDGPTWDGFQRALARADDRGRGGADPVLARALYRAREQAARADAAGRQPGERGQEQFRVHIVESAASFSDAVNRCRRFGHRVRWPGLPGS